MTKIKYIFVLVLYSLLFVPKVKAITPEQESQFKYYWYAAKQAIEEEKYPEAYVLLEFCHALNPNDGQTLTYLGILNEGLSKDEQAMKYFRLAYESDPRDQWFRYARMLLNAGTGATRKEARRVMEHALKLKPADEENLLDELLRVYLIEEEWAKALDMLDRRDALKGYDVYSASTKSRIYMAWEKPKKALEALDKYLETDPTNVSLLVYRIQILEYTKAKTKDLYPAYERVLQLDPRNMMILNNYAWALATHKGDLQKAERMSEITIQDDPTNPTYLDTYGWILHLRGKDDLAKFFLERALSNARDAQTKAEVLKHLLKIKK